MAALPAKPRTLVKRLVGLALAGAAACALAACGVDYASSDPGFPGDFQARHPIVLASAPTSLDVYPVGGALDARTVANLHAFAERYRRFGSGGVMIFTPGPHSSHAKAVYEIRKALSGAGLRGMVGVGSYVAPAGSGAAPIRLSFISLKAAVPTPCGQWPEDLASGSSVEGWKNEPYANYGCATQSMLAAQVDDPRDFVQSRALGPSDVQMRTRAIESVRNGQDPGTAWKTDLIPIGGVQ
jgi:pilus assembly protein CpaD